MQAAIHPLYRPSHGFDPSFSELLARRVYAILGTENGDGSPHLVPVAFTFDGERFLMETSANTRKARNVEARGRARVLVEAPGRTGWVAASGTARVVRGDESRRLNEGVLGRYLTAEGREVWAATVAPLDDATIVLEPQQWSSWDMSEMMTTIADHGFDPDRSGEWFLPLDE